MSADLDATVRRRSARALAALAFTLALVAAPAGALIVPNYQGLWWAAPAGSESGWGINVAHQADTIFATWFTYDPSGKALWLSMTATKTGTGTYAGTLVRTSGPPFDAVPFDPARVTRTAVGTGTLTFENDNGGTFAYELFGVQQSKALVRQQFGPLPVCAYAQPADLAGATNYTDLWWVPGGAESGWGINLAHEGETVFATWFTYAPDGSPLWLSATLRRQAGGGSYTGAVYLTSGARFDRFDPSQVQRTEVGTAAISFADGNDATLTSAIALPSAGRTVTQAKRIARQTFFPGGGTVCRPPDGTPVRVTSQTPFAAGCEGAPVSGTLFVSSEVEPFVAINPRDRSNLVGAWQQDRWSNGGAKGTQSAVSFDGGRTWARASPAFSRCAGGSAANGADFERATDPWVSFGPDGVVYQVALAFNRGGDNAMLASRSLDGGRTWSAPATLIRDGGAYFNDKESVTADPTVAGYAYATWDRLENDEHGPTWFARTVDGGVTWQPARVVYDPGPTSQTINNQVVVTSDGALALFFTRFDVAGREVTATLALIRSTDKGATWSAPVTLARVQSVGTRDPETGTPVREGSNLGAFAAGPGGLLVAAWQDARFSGGARDGIALSRSTDGGLTWSAPVRVNRDPSVRAFLPSVTVRDDGTIGVAYYDFRSNTSDPATLPTDYWLAQSSDGGLTWREMRVAGPFDLALAPYAEGLFVGDYQGLVADGVAFVPFYSIANGTDFANRTDVFASRLAADGPIAASVAAYRAETAGPMPASAELTQRLNASVVRTLERRAHARVPAVLRAPGGPADQ